jgi:hypothetical protein
MSNQLRNTVIASVVIFIVIWFVVFYHHERHHQLFPHLNSQPEKISHPDALHRLIQPPPPIHKLPDDKQKIKFHPDVIDPKDQEETDKLERKSPKDQIEFQPKKGNEADDDVSNLEPRVEQKKDTSVEKEEDHEPESYRYSASKGLLVCHGERTDSEIIYWRVVPHDIDYESPITPHHGVHDDRYLTFEYDQGGWNNIRMGMESLIVAAHAMGRTLVIPPQQHLYLLGATHKDESDKKAHDEMGFDDFFDLDLLRSHHGFNVLSMKEFLEKEAMAGGLHGEYPPQNSSDIWGQALWSYLSRVSRLFSVHFFNFLFLLFSGC